MSHEVALANIAKIVGCDPVTGDPQVTENCVYQCAEVDAPHGKTIAYRIWSRDRRDDQWMLSDCSLGFWFKEPDTCPDKWEEAKKVFAHKERVSRWRGETEAKIYYQTPWNVVGLLQQDAIGWVYGAPGSYKTVMAMDIACSIATGREWCGRKTRKGPVLYISAEGGAGIYAVRDAWEKKNGAKADHLAIYVGGPDIAEMSIFGCHPVVDLLKEFQESVGQPSALIVIDTYAQTSPDDTKAAVTAYERRIRTLIRHLAPGASVLVIDHTTKEGSTWMGSNAKLGNMDMMALVKKAGDDVIFTMRNGRGKVKNAPPFDDVRMTPRLVKLDWTRPEGGAAVAPVLEYCANTFGATEALVLNLIGDGITYGELRPAFHAHPDMANVREAARKARLSRALSDLRKKDAIDVDGLEYDQTEDGPKPRKITDTCTILPM